MQIERRSTACGAFNKGHRDTDFVGGLTKFQFRLVQVKSAFVDGLPGNDRVQYIYLLQLYESKMHIVWHVLRHLTGMRLYQRILWEISCYVERIDECNQLEAQIFERVSKLPTRGVKYHEKPSGDLIFLEIDIELWRHCT